MTGICDFVCNRCGGDRLVVDYYYVEIETVRETFPCSCGKAPNGIAATLTYSTKTLYEECGHIDSTHRFITENRRCMGDDGPYDERQDITCESCFEKASVSSSNVTTTYEEKCPEFWVRCACCEREIEFGLSQPGREGQIWPVECSDFHPSKAPPDPRYKKKWVLRRWIN